ncbi:MAG: hypothetical protein CL910_15200 [Deltaproteobacteria bacterium]|jgi:hypothetical protein|nr:hypothetical protein [Deltaproteobacteria bacterium]
MPRRAWSRSDPRDYLALDLHVHAVLAGVPVHDVWQVDLPGGGEGRTLVDLEPFMSFGEVAEAHPVVRFLFWLRGWLGSLFGWDDAPREGVAETRLARVPQEILDRSSRPPGSSDGPFEILYVLDHERVSEIRNATVQAYSVLVMEPTKGGYRALWAIHVAPVGPITRFYMALITPFRRSLIYPAVLRQVHRKWVAAYGTQGR